MAGTDHRRPTAAGGPAIVLVEPQLGENIGAAARAMLNGGLTDLRLVRPREPWPNDKARATASGADVVLEGARLFETTADAIADLERVYASTARPRDMVKPVVTPREAANEMRSFAPEGRGCGVLFGPERTGLSNEDIVRAGSVLSVPLNPRSSSLNLAHAVLLVSYEWFQAGLGDERPWPDRFDRGVRPATAGEVATFLAHLEAELDRARFLFPPEKRPIMVRNIQNIFTRPGLTEQEVRTLHGIVAALSGRKWVPDRPPEEG